MRNLFTLLLLFAATAMVAQDLPQPSPSAEVEQTIGLTEIEVEYSRPGAKGRDIFGELVPFDKLWRTGANKATAITFDNSVKFGGKEVESGTYSMFTIPGKKEWVIILNSETELWGTGGYDRDKDVARVTVEAQKMKDYEETFTIGFTDITDESGHIYLKWEKTMVSVKIEVDTKEAAWANIKSEIESLEGSWRVYVRAADYAARTGENLDQALEWTETALEMYEYWWTYMIQGQVHAAMGNYDLAIKSIEKSQELGKKMENFNYTDRLKSLKEEYQSKS